jgi:hypothetical protein
MPGSRHFPPPWTVEDKDAYFIVRDHNGQALAYVYARTSGRVPSHSPVTKRGASHQALPGCRICSVLSSGPTAIRLRSGDRSRWH